MDSAGGGSASAWYEVGDTALRKHRIDEAHNAFTQAVRIDPRHSNALYRLGEIAQSRGDLKSAEEFYRRALSVHPDHKSARERLEKLLARQAEDRPPHEPVDDGYVGRVRGLQQTQAPALITRWRANDWWWSFRLELPRTDLEPAKVLPVRLRGQSLVGDLREGDWVELPIKWRPETYLKGLRNLTTGVAVRVRRRPWILTLLEALISAFVIAWLVAIFFIVGRELFFG